MKRTAERGRPPSRWSIRATATRRPSAPTGLHQMSAHSPPSDATPPHDPEAPAALEAILTTHETAPDELTFYPADATEQELVTAWLTAHEGSFVPLEEMQ